MSDEQFGNVRAYGSIRLGRTRVMRGVKDRQSGSGSDMLCSDEGKGPRRPLPRTSSM